MFVDVELVTADDEYIRTAVISEFLKAPDCLVWGSRVFFPTQIYFPNDMDLVYREGSAVTVIRTKTKTKE